MKSVLISIRPKWCELIASGEKTIEVRKTRPKLEPPFRCYIYCTKPSKAPQTICGSHILSNDELYDELYRHPQDGIKYGDGIALMLCDDYTESSFLNGKVIGEFICDRIDKIIPSDEPYGIYDIDDDYVRQTCLENGALWNYGRGAALHGWHISDLKIYDKPKRVSEFWYPPEKYCEKELCGGCPYDQVADVNGEYSYDCEWRRPLSRPPQSWCYVEGSDAK